MYLQFKEAVGLVLQCPTYEMVIYIFNVGGDREGHDNLLLGVIF